MDILEACYLGNLNKVKEYVIRGIDVNNSSLNGIFLVEEKFHPFINKRSTPLHFALLHGHYEVIKYLIENGAKTGKMFRYGLNAVEIVKRNPYLSFWKKGRILWYLRKQRVK